MEQYHPGCDGVAEAVINLQPNSTISIAYHPLFGPHDDMVLLELDEKLLPDVLNQRFVINIILSCQYFWYIFFRNIIGPY